MSDHWVQLRAREEAHLAKALAPQLQCFPPRLSFGRLLTLRSWMHVRAPDVHLVASSLTTPRVARVSKRPRGRNTVPRHA